MSKWETMVAEGSQSASIAIAFLFLHFLQQAFHLDVTEECKYKFMEQMSVDIQKWLDADMKE